MILATSDECCCNSVAFALSMLCLKYVADPIALCSIIHDSQISCQQGLGSGVGADTGIDAGTLQATSQLFGLADYPYRCRCIPGLFD